MKKRILSMLLAIAMVCSLLPTAVFAAETTYDLWVGGVQVTSANKDNIVVPDATGTATYDHDSKTLTLNNFSYTGQGYVYDSPWCAAIYTTNDLTVNLVGSNTVTASVTGDYTAEALNVWGALTITGDSGSTLTLTGAGRKGVDCGGNLKIEDVTVNATGLSGLCSWEGNITINNATVYATATASGIYEGAIIALEKNITIENSKVTATASSGNAISIESGDLIYNTCTIKNSEVTISNAKCGMRLATYANLKVENSTLTITAIEKAIDAYGANDILVDNHVVYAGDNASAGKVDASTNATYANKYVRIEPLHKHCVCGGAHAAIGTHTTEENPTWVAISSADDFSKNKDSGYYYLTDDIEVSAKWEFTKQRDIVLCLNGYDITYTGNSNASFIDGSSVNFTLTDCQAEAGSISGFKNTYGGAINVKKTFTMYNGKITGNTASQGGGVYVGQNATFYMYGGEITGNTASTLGGGVFSQGSIEVAGAPVVNNNANSNTATTYPSSMYKYTKNIYSSTGAVAVGTGGLTTGAQLDITPMFPVSSSEKPAATVTIAKECTSDLSGYFTYTSGFNYTKQYDATAGEVQLVYAPVKYTVTFNMQGHGTQVEEQSVETGTYAIEPSPAPTAQGYTFGGWYTTPECGYWDDFIFDFFKITADTTLYAKWTPNVYTVEFVNDDGTVLQSSEVPYGETPEYTGETPTKAATAQYTYSFNGWDSTITSVTGAKTYTAQFSSTVNKYTVTFVDYDGAELQSGTIPYGSAAVAPADPNREGHTFAGWDKDFSNITGELTVNAQYSINQYTITFDTDSGSAVAPITQDYNTAVEKPTDPAKTGFDFGGWYADAELTNAYVFGTMPAANITVYARWNPATGTAYTVKHYHQNTSGSGYTLYESETLRGTTNAETAAEAKNYLGFTAQTFPQTTILPDGTAVVEIKYDRNTYTVTLVTNGGTIRDGDVTEYTYGVGAKLPTNVTRSGYHFGGWYDNEDCEGTPVTQITTTDIGNKTFYAKWKYIYIPIITPTYPPVVDGGNNGNVDVSPRNPKQDDTVTFTPNPDAGYEVDEVIVTDKNGNPVTVFDNGDGTYSFKQPNGKVTIKVTFAEIDVTCPGNNTCPMYGYTDLDMTAWYHDGVHFCIANDLMTGIASDTFAPGMTTSRAMIVTILWGLEGKPVVNCAMSFEDVAADTWYTEAIRWAASEDIVNGYSDTAFGPNDNITREQLATILYRYEQKNGGGFKGMWMFRMDYVDLADVSDWAYEAMCWMNMNSIVNGKPGKVLDPKGNATRAEAATMLYRYCDVIGKDDEN